MAAVKDCRRPASMGTAPQHNFIAALAYSLIHYRSDSWCRGSTIRVPPKARVRRAYSASDPAIILLGALLRISSGAAPALAAISLHSRLLHLRLRSLHHHPQPFCLHPRFHCSPSAFSVCVSACVQRDPYFPRIPECTLRFWSPGISNTHSPCTCKLAKLRIGFVLAICSYTLVLGRINSMSANRLRFCLFRASALIPNSCMALHSCEHLGLYQCTYINIFLETFLNISYQNHYSYGMH